MVLIIDRWQDRMKDDEMMRRKQEQMSCVCSRVCSSVNERKRDTYTRDTELQARNDFKRANEISE